MNEDAQRRLAPSDAACLEAWVRIMKVAEEHCLVIDAGVGVVVLAMPEVQRKTGGGLRERVLEAHFATEAP